MEKLYKVRPLEWAEKDGTWKAVTPAGNYFIIKTAVGLRWYSDLRAYRGGEADYLTRAKQLAEADWLARISPALEGVGNEADFVTKKEPGADFEQWYVKNIPDLELEPLGCRACGLMRKAWNAAATSHVCENCCGTGLLPQPEWHDSPVYCADCPAGKVKMDAETKKEPGRELLDALKQFVDAETSFRSHGSTPYPAGELDSMALAYNAAVAAIANAERRQS